MLRSKYELLCCLQHNLILESNVTWSLGIDRCAIWRNMSFSYSRLGDALEHFLSKGLEQFLEWSCELVNILLDKDYNHDDVSIQCETFSITTKIEFMNWIKLKVYFDKQIIIFGTKGNIKLNRKLVILFGQEIQQILFMQMQLIFLHLLR